MAVSNAKRLSIAKYQQEKCDRITVDVPKGKREVYKAAAAKLGLSLSMLIQHGVESYGGGIATESFTKPEKPESLSADERRLIDEFNRLPSDTRKALVKLVKSINQAGVVVKPSDQTTPK